MPEKAIPPEMQRAARNRHPLYRKLTGDVVWVLFEEKGYDADTCGKYLDSAIATMHTDIADMLRLEEDARLFLALDAQQPCAPCSHLAGKAIPVSAAGWQQFIPRFGVACSATMHVLSAEEVQQQGYSIISPDAVSLPVCPLLCPLLPDAT